MMEKKRVYPIILLIIIIFGHLWVLFPQIDLGVALTVYRVAIPIFTIYSFSQYCQKNKIYTKSFKFFLYVMGIWLVWGMLALLYSPYSDFREAIKELLSVLLGACSVICVYKLINEPKDLASVFCILKASVIFLISIAWVETFTDWHLLSSSLAEEEYVVLKLGSLKLYGASTIFYNVNDFYAFLGIMSVLFFDKFYKIQGIFVLISSLFLMVLNDANICLIAMVAAFMIFQLFRSHGLLKKVIIGLIITGFFITSNIIFSSRFSIYSIGEIFSIQIENARLGVGSLYQRMAMYMESIEAVLKTNGLGLGPAGFTPYFLVGYHKTDLINPHNYWLEILSQYGVIVFGLYLWLYIGQIWRMVKIYREKSNPEAAILIAMLMAFVLASMAPSSFLTYSYQWIVLALCLSLDKIYIMTNKRMKNIY